MRTFVAALVLLLLGSGLAWAGPKVPEITPAQLPVAGTCAPLPSQRVTWVTAGDPGWYRIDGDLRDVDAGEMTTVLKARGMFAAQAGESHDVWIIARADHEWQQVVNVLVACQTAGLHRVGLQVRSETDGTTYGFPLFLPYGRGGARPEGPKPTARRLEVRMNADAEQASDPYRLYAAASAAVRQFAPVVAKISISVRTRVQDAVTAIDLLYRAGCAAVRLPYRMIVENTSGPTLPRIWVEERLLPSEQIDLEVPPVQPRREPWGDDGAAAAGAFSFELEPIPSGDPGEAEEDERLRPLPHYAARSGEVPVEARADATAELKQWSAIFGGWLTRILTQERLNIPETLLVKRRRQWEGVQGMFAAAREAFSNAAEVRPSTLRVQAYLFEGAKVVGRVDATLCFAGPSIDVLFAYWVNEESPTELILPPRETEPYSSGVPGQLRVWIEAMLATLRARGVEALPLAPVENVLQDLPPVAHAGARGAIARRGPALDALAAWLRQTPYDRVFITLVSGQAGVIAPDGTVAGVLRYDLEGELGNLSMSKLTARVAPR